MNTSQKKSKRTDAKQKREKKKESKELWDDVSGAAESNNEIRE